jgi:RNA polymerase sigma factor (TIGR02999 family)
MLDRASAGDRQAAAELLPVVYRQLRAQAQQQLMNERPGHTLQATALVHEAFMKLVGPEQTSFAGRAHFYAAAAEAMRRILIDHARARGAVKRGRDWTRDAGRLEDLVGPDDGGGLLELDDAIEALRRHEPRAADVVTLRFYGGLSIDQIALLQGVSARTVDRVWRFARAWLLRELAPTNDDDRKGTTHDG